MKYNLSVILVVLYWNCWTYQMHSEITEESLQNKQHLNCRPIWWLYLIIYTSVSPQHFSPLTIITNRTASYYTFSEDNSIKMKDDLSRYSSYNWQIWQSVGRCASKSSDVCQCSSWQRLQKYVPRAGSRDIMHPSFDCWFQRYIYCLFISYASPLLLFSSLFPYLSPLLPNLFHPE